ncbi:hypothetical protein [uncultured Gimesia sp.]|uniref:hypothetical protein n=1 Tax=uncultured Gimesia sp. TaxID=1678688 RepID=UPI0030DCBC64|tara:strand:+ start:124714 stop:125205 length:492 start_codon:yes stop_codon:yes gene_type:complete
MKSTMAVCVLFLSLGAADAAQQDDAAKQREMLEKKFETQMSGATLVGHFTVDGKTNGKPPREERYEIASAKKLNGDQWLITARIKYGKNDVNVPMPLNVFWAGDTPVISLTNLTIPGLGNAFTSRVMFFEGRYAGTWQHGKVGGNLWGRIEYANQNSETEEEK